MQRPASSIRSVLVGFAGLLVLMGALAVDSAKQTRQALATSTALRKESRDRDELLDQLRTDVYRSATLVRDYMIERDDTRAESAKTELEKLHVRIGDALNQYAKGAPAAERDAIQQLKQYAESYWNSVAPTLGWNRRARSGQGEYFIQSTIVPVRNEFVQFVKQVNSLDERALDAAEARLQGLEAQFERRVNMISILALVLGSILAIAVVRHVRRLGKEAADRFDEVLEAREDLRRLSDRLVAIQEEERRALSRELHDDLGQTMSAMLIEIGKLEAAGAAGTDHQNNLTGLRTMAEDNVAKVRNMALLLRPAMLDELGLVAALNWQTREVARRTGLRVKLIADELNEDLPEISRTCIYRVVQEALNNCVKHSLAKSVRVTIQRDAQGLAVSVQDDGVGFNPGHSKGLGLLGMMERVTGLGGRFHIESEAGRGTVLSTYFPLEGHRCRHQRESVA